MADRDRQRWSLEEFAVSQRHNASVYVMVAGGEQQFPYYQFVSNESVLAALESSVDESGVFKRAATLQDAEYSLDVVMMPIGRDLAGLHMETRFVARWELLARGRAEPVFRELIESTGKATMSDSLIGMSRLRIATERAVQENLKIGVERLSRLQLSR